MTINRYDEGDIVRVQGDFFDQNQQPLDPSAVMFSYKNPAGASITLTYTVDPQPVRSDVGVYWATIDALVPGMWYYRWYSTGSGQAAGHKQFYVEHSPV